MLSEPYITSTDAKPTAPPPFPPPAWTLTPPRGGPKRPIPMMSPASDPEGAKRFLVGTEKPAACIWDGTTLWSGVEARAQGFSARYSGNLLWTYLRLFMFSGGTLARLGTLFQTRSGFRGDPVPSDLPVVELILDPGYAAALVEHERQVLSAGPPPDGRSFWTGRFFVCLGATPGESYGWHGNHCRVGLSCAAVDPYFHERGATTGEGVALSEFLLANGFPARDPNWEGEFTLEFAGQDAKNPRCRELGELLDQVTEGMARALSTLRSRAR